VEAATGSAAVECGGCCCWNSEFVVQEVAGGGGAVGLRCCYCTVEEKVAAPGHVAGLGVQRSYWSLLLMAGTEASAAVVAPIGRELLMKPTHWNQRC